MRNIILMSSHGGLTSDHDSADVCSAEVFQHRRGFCFQLVLHDDQAQKLHVGLNVVSSFKKHKRRFFNEIVSTVEDESSPQNPVTDFLEIEA